LFLKINKNLNYSKFEYFSLMQVEHHHLYLEMLIELTHYLLHNLFIDQIIIKFEKIKNLFTKSTIKY